MSYLNLDTRYFDHPKTRRLIGVLGRGSEVLPLRLWSYAAEYHEADGDLSNYSDADLEKICHWWGKKGKMIEALIQTGFIDRYNGTTKLHNWQEHEGHLSALKQRNRLNAKSRWDKYRSSAAGNASGTATGTPKECQSDAPNLPNLPNLPSSPVKTEDGDATKSPSGNNGKLTDQEKVDVLKLIGVKRREPLLSGDVVAALKKWIPEQYPILTGDFGRMAGYAFGHILKKGLGKNWEKNSPESAEFFQEILIAGLGSPQTEERFYAHIETMCAPGNGQNLHEWCHNARKSISAKATV